jgi:myo-inositol-1(or 4)-monophosphatase
MGRADPGRRSVIELAERIAREAGAQLREAFAVAAVDIQTKSSPTDLVSAADVAAETLIREALLAERPEDGMLGEEGSDTPGTSGLRWIVDPLDGTTNFLFGIPQWGVSIAVEDESGTLAGVVFDPMRDECWAAVRGAAPTLNGEPLRRPKRAGGLAGFGYDADVRAIQAEGVTRLLPRVRDIRRVGSAAIDLAWTAAGRYDAYYERGVKLWDIAAGELICASAGLHTRRLAPAPPAESGILVAPAAMAEELAGLVD